MGIGLVYPKFATHHNHLLLLQIEFIHFSLYKVNIGCPGNQTALVFPVHPRTTKNLREFGLYDVLNDAPKIFLFEPLGYKAFMNLVFGCKFVKTDSGGIQEETTYLKIPCLTLRPNTERPVTITQGTNKLSAPERIEADLEEVIKKDSKESPLFWDGKTSARVVEAMKTTFSIK